MFPYRTDLADGRNVFDNDVADGDHAPVVSSGWGVRARERERFGQIHCVECFLSVLCVLGGGGRGRGVNMGAWSWSIY